MSAPLSLWQIGNGIGVGHLIYTPLACGMAVRAGQTSLNHGDASMRRATRKQQARIYTIGVLTLTGPNPEEQCASHFACPTPWDTWDSGPVAPPKGKDALEQ